MICNCCGNEIKKGDPYIEGTDCYICKDCIARVGKFWAKSVGIEIWEGTDTEKDEQKPKLKTPKEIKEFLDQYIVGQDEAKRRLAVSVYNHYKRLEQGDTSDDIEIQKSNALLLGASGSGKTLLAQTIAKMLDVPIAIVDATTLTEAGYVGDDVETIISKLLQAADWDVEKAQKGIIFIDEFDKISRKGDNPSITRDVSGEGVQQALLKIIEGTTVGVAPHGGRKHPDQPLIQVNTKNILFICAGAFEGIEKKIGQRLNMRSVGYTATINRDNKIDKSILSYVSAQDLRAYGLIPEIIGRLPIITHTEELTEDEMRRILTEPKNAIIKQYKKLMLMDNIKVTFDENALKEIVKYTLESKTGARGLRSVIEQVMAKPMFELPGTNRKSLKITEKYVKEQLVA